AIVLETLRGGAPEIAEPPSMPAETTAPTTGKQIVVVDDTEMLLIFVEDILTTADPELQITTALSASEGLREIERLIPDLVLLDYSLPDFNGDELCERLLDNERTAHVPVLMMSGHVTEMNATAARFPNVVATIEKPFLSDALVDLVQRTLAGDRPMVERVPPQPVYSPIIEPVAPAAPKEEIAPEPI